MLDLRNLNIITISLNRKEMALYSFYTVFYFFFRRTLINFTDLPNRLETDCRKLTHRLNIKPNKKLINIFYVECKVYNHLNKK